MFIDKKIVRYLFLLPVLLAYLPVLVRHQHVDPDAKVILENLYSVGNVSGYLRNLFSFHTVDFQPLRDLTLSLDIWTFYELGINTFVAQNLFWWMASLLVFSRIIYLLFPRLENLTHSLIISCVGIYPLYSGVISWGMNRKHLLALFFITLATYFLIRSSAKRSAGDILRIAGSFILSALSQPIHILWPLWAAAYLFHTKTIKLNVKLLLVLSLSLLTMALINGLYYSNSETYKLFYTDKTADLWNVPDKILAIGHYLFQLMFPYLLSFKYDLSHWSVLTGVFLLPVACLFLFKMKNRRELLLWDLAGLLPIMVVLNDPHVISDAYLLYPGFAFCILILFIARDYEMKLSRYWLIVPMLIWGGLAARNSQLWNSRLDLAKASFDNRPSCENALNYLKVSYDYFKRSPDALAFAESNECFKDMTVTGSFYASMSIMFAHYYFHEEKLPLEFRIERLKQMTDKHLYARMSLIGLYLKNGYTAEAREEIRGLPEQWTGKSEEFHEITARFVHPFCVKENLTGCLLITEKLIRKPDRPNL